MRSQYPHTEELYTASRHPAARRRHVRQVWLQIALPLILGTALGGFGLYALLTSQAGTATRASQLATVVLAIPLLVMGLVILLALVAAIYLLGRSMRWIPEHTIYVHRWLQQANTAILRGADYAAKPMLAAQSWANAFSRIFDRSKRLR
ncbi:MAG: hypothetical protein KF701_03275 [Anaerolineales bacterium]|nr:MAG: hypothetical protein KF701_03275 [Anaerolineales bacterium]